MAARQLTGTERPNLSLDELIPSSNTKLSKVLRSAARLFSALNGDVLDSKSPPSSVEVLEDALLTATLRAFEPPHEARNPFRLVPKTPLNDLEVFYLAHLDKQVNRTNLAAQLNVSVRTLSRPYQSRNGFGAMEFFRQRRMDASYRALLGAAPDALRVSDEAYRYGFRHLGKFTIEYKRIFGESPSATLSH